MIPKHEKYMSRINTNVNPHIDWRAIESSGHQRQIEKLLIREFNKLHKGDTSAPADVPMIIPARVKRNGSEYLGLLTVSNNRAKEAMIYTRGGLKPVHDKLFSWRPLVKGVGSYIPG